MSLLLKRDETGTGYPHPSQISVGELQINSVTGKLYTKLVDGSIVEFSSQKVCFDPTPEVSFYYNNIQVVDNINSFCCLGDILVVEIKNLKLEPAEYSFELVELTTNTSQDNIVLSETQYSIYTTIINQQSVSLRKANIPINLSITQSNNISIFKFTVLSAGNKLLEKLITIKCYEGSCSGS